jgi:hypothetical protein
MSRPAVLAILGAAACVVGLFLPWYEITGGLKPGQLQAATKAGIDLKFSGWEYNSVLDILLALVAVAGAGAAVLRQSGVTLMAGLIAAVLVVGRLLDGPPGDRVDTRIGIYLSLAGGLILAVSGAWQRQRTDNIETDTTPENVTNP